MKPNFYTFFYTGLLLFTLMGGKASAQCLCPQGDTPDSTVYTQNHDSITAVTTALVFPQFTASTGTLACLKLSSNVTTVINIDLFNKEAVNITYLLESYRRSQFSGPGGFFSSVSSPIKNYGPYDLGPVDPVGTGDEVHIGPDTVFNNRYNQNYHTNVVPYLGTGNVTFDYLNTSTTTLLQGSSNYDLIVRSYTRLNARLVYYWCPNFILATNITNFSAYKKDKTIFLKWLAENANNSSFEIQHSKDGRTFVNIGNTAKQHTSQSSASFQHEFHPQAGTNGKQFFRIRQVDANGKVSYTAVRTVNLNEDAAAGFTVYPNPVKSKVSMQFDRLLKGDFVIEVTNLMGQVIYSRNMKLNNSNTIQFDLTTPPAAGVYYLRAKDIVSKQVYTGKLVIQQ